MPKQQQRDNATILRLHRDGLITDNHLQALKYAKGKLEEDQFRSYFFSSGVRAIVILASSGEHLPLGSCHEMSPEQADLKALLIATGRAIWSQDTALEAVNEAIQIAEEMLAPPVRVEIPAAIPVREAVLVGR